MSSTLISNNEREFIKKALVEGQRLDGRGLYDFRKIRISFGTEYGQVQVQLGKTRVIAVVSGEITLPLEDRPTEGFLFINTEFSPMASEGFEAGRPTDDMVELARVVDRGLKDSRAIDTEGLCVVAGEKVWAIRCDIHIVDHDGNLVDVANLAAVLALKHYRRNDISVSGEDVTIFDFEEREPVPLTIHHTPISVTFGFFHEGATLLVDQTWKEECVREGSMTVTMNSHKEICCLHKGGGVAIEMQQLLVCTKIAEVKVTELQELIDDAINNTEKYTVSTLSIPIVDNEGKEATSSTFGQQEGKMANNIDNDQDIQDQLQQGIFFQEKHGHSNGNTIAKVDATAMDEFEAFADMFLNQEKSVGAWDEEEQGEGEEEEEQEEQEVDFEQQEEEEEEEEEEGDAIEVDDTDQ